jgi:uncharacterized protein
VKDPFWLTQLCADLDIPHPEVRADRPTDGPDWLSKRSGGAGGAHVQAADKMRHHDKGLYYQRRVSGQAVSALFLADGEQSMSVGFSEQWSDPLPGAPSRYGGAVRPAQLDTSLIRTLDGVVQRLTRAVGLKGLNSVDFLVDAEEFWLIEINPRPGATLDLFDSDQAPLFGLHVDACRGALPARLPPLPDAAAAATVYATRPISTMPDLDWPAWSADRQPGGSAIGPGEPICTVRAEANTRHGARVLVEERRRAMLALAQQERS